MRIGNGVRKAATAAATALVLGLAGLGLGGCDRPTSAEGPPPAAETPEAGVAVIRPSRAALTAELAGRAAPYLVAEIRPQVGGVIQKRPFREGADVQAGELLYQIDPDSFQAAVDRAAAALARSQAAVAPARLKFERYRELLKNNAISRQDHDEAEAAFRQAEADVAANKAALQAAAIDLTHTRVTGDTCTRFDHELIGQTRDGELLPTLIAGISYEELRDLNDQFTRTDNELVVALDNALRRAGFDGWGLKVYHPKAKGDERRIYAPDPNPPKKHLGHGTGLSTVVRVDV